MIINPITNYPIITHQLDFNYRLLTKISLSVNFKAIILKIASSIKFIFGMFIYSSLAILCLLIKVG